MIEIPIPNFTDASQTPEIFWFFIFMFALIDSTFAVGIILSGVGTLTIALLGYTSNSILIPEIAFFGFLGAYIGDIISYYFGRYISKNTQHSIDLKNKTLSRIIDAGQRASIRAKSGMDRYGFFFFLIGRWLPIASLLPFSYALLGVKWKRFIILDAIACFVWAVGWCLFIFVSVNGLRAII